MFEGRRLCIATMHKKEVAIRPVLESALGVRGFTCRKLNTDTFGTFTGEVARSKSPLETARDKCIAAMVLSRCDMAVASEGSFGPDPFLGFVNSDEEILYFFDKRNGVEVAVKEKSFHTNFSGADVYSFEQLSQFARRALFPDHGLIVKTNANTIVEKGITSWRQLGASFNKAAKRGLPVKVETDMRAHMNPSRMAVIKLTAQKLVEAIRSVCPQCELPGFTVTEAEPGLPCSWCGSPTRSTLYHVLACKRCGHRADRMYPHGKTKEDPMYCDSCNP